MARQSRTKRARKAKADPETVKANSKDRAL
jgi:hypothetical protein